MVRTTRKEEYGRNRVEREEQPKAVALMSCPVLREISLHHIVVIVLTGGDESLL